MVQWAGNLWKGGMNTSLNPREDHLMITCCLSFVKDFHIHDPIQSADQDLHPGAAVFGSSENTQL